MKIKNQRGQLSDPRREKQRRLISNKENLVASERKQDCKPLLRSKATFGEDITKRVNEPAGERFNFTLPSAKSELQVPRHLVRPTAFNPEIAPYEQEIINYIIQTHSEAQFSATFRKKLKNKKNKRRFVVERMYKVFKSYRLRRKTLFLSVYYFDKYIRLVDEKDYCRQLLIGEACLLIAMKYEEIYPPLLSQWASGREKLIIEAESRVLKALDFKLAYTTPQHYLEIYFGKGTSSKEEKRLYELIFDLFLFAGHVYDEHPLKTTQQILESFRPTAFMERDSAYQESDRKVKQVIEENAKIWQFLIEMDLYREKK